MATKFVFPKAPKVGDRIEIVSISESKLPINIVGNSEAEKDLILIFPGETKSGESDGEMIIATISENNIVYTFKCVTAQNAHTWLLEGTCLYPVIADHASEITAIKSRLDAIESVLADELGEIE
jgi:hypothetical protein